MSRTYYCFPWFCFTLLLLLAARLLPDQDGPYAFMHYCTEQGLSNDNVICVERDRPGFLWIGTTNGLNRFDGRRFRVFRHDPDKPGGLPDDFIGAMTSGPDGWLWISTGKGLCRLNPETLQFVPVPLPGDRDTSTHDRRVSKVMFDRKGRAWVYGPKALYCLDPQGGQAQTYTAVVSDEGALPLYVDRQDGVWILLQGRLYRFDPVTGQTILYPKGSEKTPAMNAIDLAEDHNDNLWVTTWSNGLYRYDRKADDLVQVVDGVHFGLNRQLLPDLTPAGRPFFWVGGGVSGLFLYFPDQHFRLEFPNDPRDPYTHNGLYASTLFRDERTGDVWIGTELGLEHYSPTAIRFGRAIIPKEPDFGPFNLVSGAVKDKTDPSGQNYFIGVWANSFFQWNRQTSQFKRFKPGRELPAVSAEVFCIMQDRDGYLWQGLNGSICRYDPRNGQTKVWKDFFRRPKRANKMMASVQDRYGVLWFGANGDGLFRLLPSMKKPERIPMPDDVVYPNGDLFIHTMAADSLGRLWLGTNKGLTRYDPATGTAIRFRIPGKPEVYECIGVTVARNGHAWCTVEDWLVEVDGNGNLVQTLRPEHGIKCSRAMFVVEDETGNIWFNSDYLLHCLDTRTGTFSHYGLADGLFSNAPTDALSALPNGEIIVGFQNAFNYFHPSLLRRNTTPPPVVITSVRVLDEERRPDDPLVLRPGENMISVEFAALNFSQPERNRYAYMLEGFDHDWNYSDRPVAVYTNLDGGQYTLRLKAANNDGVWNETGATLAFRVIPPFYRRRYFYLALILLGVGITYTIARYRYQQRRRLDLFRERLARDLHDEMGSTLSSIRFFSDFAQTQIAADKPETLPVLQRISQSATTLSESMQDIIWAMKAREDQLEDIASRMTDFGLRLLEARGIRFKTHIDAHLPSKHLLPEQRRNLYLIFKEAINNAAKYANCSAAELIFKVEHGELVMAVNDNGQGFDPDSKKTGNGLHNMRQRATEIGGRLQIISAPGQGTQILFKVKM